MEGALKLKEVSYIHAESYAAGELKHGTLALISPETPVIAVATQDDVSAKMYSNIQEVRARGAEVLGIGFVDDTEIAKYTTETVRIPRVDPFIAPILAVIPMQDLLQLDGSARMNTPGTSDGNWKWCMRPGDLEKVDAAKLHALAVRTGRA